MLRLETSNRIKSTLGYEYYDLVLASDFKIGNIYKFCRTGPSKKDELSLIKENEKEKFRYLGRVDRGGELNDWDFPLLLSIEDEKLPSDDYITFYCGETPQRCYIKFKILYFLLNDQILKFFILDSFDDKINELEFVKHLTNRISKINYCVFEKEL